MEEELNKGLKNMAETLSEYHKLLLKEGISEKLADKLVIDYHNGLVNAILTREQMKEFQNKIEMAFDNDEAFDLDLDDLGDFNG